MLNLFCNNFDRFSRFDVCMLTIAFVYSTVTETSKKFLIFSDPFEYQHVTGYERGSRFITFNNDASNIRVSSNFF